MNESSLASITCCPPKLKVLLVLLRLAIGWHLLYEGLYKLDSYVTNQPWSSRSYLERSEGPFQNWFRGLTGKSPSQNEFDEKVILGSWIAYLDYFEEHYVFDLNQRESAEGELRHIQKELKEQVYDAPEMRRTYQQYADDVLRESRYLTLSQQTRLDANREMLQNKVGELTTQYETQLAGLLSEKQRRRGPLPATCGVITVIDRLVVWGLILSGGCLLVGLLSRFAAVTAALMLLMFFIAMPPMPGSLAATEGFSHYRYVNNNLLEALALLTLATTRSGRWWGLDTLLEPIWKACWQQIVNGKQGKTTGQKHSVPDV